MEGMNDNKFKEITTMWYRDEIKHLPGFIVLKSLEGPTLISENQKNLEHLRRLKNLY